RDGDAAAPAGGDGAREEPIPIGIFRQEERSEYCESYRTRVMEPAARSAGAEPPAPQDALAPTECEEPES
ncbi:MAG: hypothetical protein ACOCWX_03360, partial [Spirochaetota bacterium]